MMTEMDDPMVLESILAARAREKQDDSPASSAMEVTEQGKAYVQLLLYGIYMQPSIGS